MRDSLLGGKSVRITPLLILQHKLLSRQARRGLNLRGVRISFRGGGEISKRIIWRGEMYEKRARKVRTNFKEQSAID